MSREEDQGNGQGGSDQEQQNPESRRSLPGLGQEPVEERRSEVRGSRDQERPGERAEDD
jgi:hypothetical protein